MKIVFQNSARKPVFRYNRVRGFKERICSPATQALGLNDHERPCCFTYLCVKQPYIEIAGIRDAGKPPLFRSAAGRSGTLTEKPMNRVDAWRMIQRRSAELGLRVNIGCHTFRATGITAYLEAGGTLENAQAMAAHESPRTTKLYDRTGDEITLAACRT